MTAGRGALLTPASGSRYHSSESILLLPYISDRASHISVSRWFLSVYTLIWFALYTHFNLTFQYRTMRSLAVTLAVLGAAQAQYFPPMPQNVTTVKSKYNDSITINYKDVSFTRLVPARLGAYSAMRERVSASFLFANRTPFEATAVSFSRCP